MRSPLDTFIACGRSRDEAHELASEIWLAIINNLEENKHTFLLLERFAQEGDLFLPFPYSRSYKVLRRVFKKLFTDYRDYLSRADYYDALACAKSMLKD
ncbi:FBOX [Musa troglodytarum]|uniref:FBOX n=1 Tax=Musa troglodytarum TaxID=320322 RepID=A0A9E7KWH7_9LILI|nr:FBOX [Musa troglodytarum]